VRRLTSRGVEHFLAQLSAVLAHVYLRVHETSPGVSAGVTTALVTHDAVHQTREGQTPYTTGTVALQAGARVDKVLRWARALPSLITRQGPPGCVQHDPRPDASHDSVASQTQSQILMTSRRLRRVMADTGSGYSPGARPGSWRIMIRS
jgi:hypothetical protein